MRKIYARIIIIILLCYTNRANAGLVTKDTAIAPPLVTTGYNDSFYNSVLEAAIGFAQPYLLQQGYFTMPGLTVVDTSLVYNGVTYPTSNTYYTPRTTGSDGFYISSTQYTSYGVTGFGSIWPSECPNIFFVNNTFHSSTDCIGYGSRVIASVGGNNASDNAYLLFANAILNAKICHLAPIGHAPDSYEMATSFATLQTTPASGWEYISGNILYDSINSYNHQLDNTLGTYTGVRKGGFGLAKQGDMLCLGDGPLSSNNGHTMVMATNPITLNATSFKTFFPSLSSTKTNAFINANKVYQVDVYDDCNNLHYNDSRATSKITGIGYGTILLVADTSDDAPIGYFFSPSTTLTYTPLDSSKTYAICVARYTNPAQLPVKIVTFSATAHNKTIENNWQTASEVNLDEFVVERSNNGVDFTAIGNIKARGSGANSYQYIDNLPLDGLNYYRLKSVDKTGDASYSKVVSCQLLIGKILTVYPNPSKDAVTVLYSHIYKVEVVDNRGKIVYFQSYDDATNPVMKVNNLSVGIYHLRIQTTNGGLNTVDFVKD